MIFKMVGSHEHSNEPFGSIMSVGEFQKYMRNSKGKVVLVHATEAYGGVEA